MPLGGYRGATMHLLSSDSQGLMHTYSVPLNGLHLNINPCKYTLVTTHLPSPEGLKDELA